MVAVKEKIFFLLQFNTIRYFVNILSVRVEVVVNNIP